MTFFQTRSCWIKLIYGEGRCQVALTFFILSSWQILAKARELLQSAIGSINLRHLILVLASCEHGDERRAPCLLLAPVGFLLARVLFRTLWRGERTTQSSEHCGFPRELSVAKVTWRARLWARFAVMVLQISMGFQKSIWWALHFWHDLVLKKEREAFKICNIIDGALLNSQVLIFRTWFNQNYWNYWIH